MVLCSANAADAHQPVFLDATDRTARTAPLLLDGTVSFAVYGSIDRPDDERWIRAKLRRGDALAVELLIPNQEPERSRPADAAPVATVFAPSGATLPVNGVEPRVFDEPFSRTSYVTVSAYRGVAEAGVYAVRITASTPARFTIVIGSNETRGAVRGESPHPPDALRRWWTRPPTPSTAKERGVTQT
jgi:hypothetical protein